MKFATRHLLADRVLGTIPLQLIQKYETMKNHHKIERRKHGNVRKNLKISDVLAKVGPNALARVPCI